MFYRGSKRGAGAGAAVAACALAALLGVAGCSSGASQPSWSKGLGSGVTIVPPGTASPGNDSPGGVMEGLVGDVTSGHAADFCKYEMPSQQSQCNTAMASVTPAQAASQLPTFKNLKLGYIAIDGTKALIGITGTICVPNQTPNCFTNNDPAAIFASGKPFATLWAQAVAAPANVYSLSPTVNINGKWYAYTSSGG